MKAIVHHRYGHAEALELEDMSRPTVGDEEVLVRVRSAAINPFDWHYLTGEPYVARVGFGLRAPKTTGVGIDLAGVVEEVGADVTDLQPGDEVYGMIDEVTLDRHPDCGTLAEYTSTRAEMLIRKPEGLSFEEAAAVPTAALTALQALRDWAGVEPGQHVLVNGASGGVGTFAVQIAKVLGAEVTGVCSTRNLELVASLGADHVIDYTRDDFAVRGPYDVILDNVGNRALSDCRHALTPDGVYVASFGRPEHHWFGPLATLGRMAVANRFTRQRLRTDVTKPSGDDLRRVDQLIRHGAVRVVLDRTYPLDDAAEAMQHLEDGHARGKVAITV